MRVREVGDLDVAELAPFTGLTDVQLRLKREPAEGIFIAEGHNVIVRALEAGLEPISALMEPRWYADLETPLAATDCDVFLADQALLKQVTGFRLHRGALAAFRRWPLPTVDDVVGEARTLVVLEDLVDHTNVGLIFRTVAGLGADAVLVSPKCADPLYRRSVKVSMGAVFSVPWTRAQPWPWVVEDLQQRGFELLALTPDPDAVSLRQYRRESGQKVALALGTEGPGLSTDLFARADRRLRVPMANGIDSLNVAATAAVACFVIVGSEVGGSTGKV